MKRKLIGILLLFLWIFQCSFPMLLYHFQRSRCRDRNLTEFNEGYAERQTHTFSFHKHEWIDWEIEGKEFKLKGHLYDVISISENDENITITCAADSNEDQVIAHYQKSLKKKTRYGTQNHQVKKMPGSKYVKNLDGFFYAADTKHLNNFFENSFNVRFVSLEIIPPPPKC